MKTKQIISIVVTGVVIIAVGITGVASNVISSKLIQKNKADTSSIVKEILSSETGSNIDLPEKDFVGVINIEGQIGASSSSSLTSDNTYNHDLYLKYIEKMEERYTSFC